MSRPLEGIRVLDFTHGVAGPYCSMILGDLGCDVIKIEKPQRGDPTRYMNVSDRFLDNIPHVGGDYFLAINRNKRSLTVDMKSPEGVGICKELALWSDVALQSFRPGVMERLGLDYASLSATNPGLVYGSLSAYGPDGPLAGKPGMDVAIQARSGVMDSTGLPGMDEPVRPAVSLADFSGGVFLALGVISALFEQMRSGKGQQVEMSLMDATMSMLSNYAVAVLDGGADLQRMGSGHPQLVPYQAFPTCDGHVVISAGTNKLYRALCTAIGREDLGVEPRFATNDARVRNRDELVPLLSEVLHTRSTAAWIDVFDAAGVPSAPVNSLAQAFREPQLRASKMVETITHSVVGDINVAGIPFKYGRSKGDIRRPPPCLGEHTDEILTSLLGRSSLDIETLRARGVI